MPARALKRAASDIVRGGVMDEAPKAPIGPPTRIYGLRRTPMGM